MYDSQSLSHTKWECKYHIVWIPKYRKKALFVELRKYLGEILRELAKQKECEVLEGHLMPDHVHIMLSIPPKYSVSQVVEIHQRQERNPDCPQLPREEEEFRWSEFLGHFWARGYYVSIAGKDEEVVRAHIQAQEKEDQRLEQLNLFE